MEILIKAGVLADLPHVAQSIIEFAGEEKIWALTGDMGTGKTTLTKAICAALGVRDIVQSPTFSIVNEYMDKQGDPIFHFDFYRLKSPEEALEIGIEDYFYSGNLCLIEWPKKIGGLLPEQFLKIAIENKGGERRNYKLKRSF